MQLGSWYDVLLFLLGLAIGLGPLALPWLFRAASRAPRARFLHDLSLVAAAAFIQAILAPLAVFLLVLVVAVPFQLTLFALDLYPGWGSLKANLLAVGLLDLAFGLAISRWVFRRWVRDGRLTLLDRPLAWLARATDSRPGLRRAPIAAALLAVPLLNAALYSELSRMTNRPSPGDRDTSSLARFAWIAGHLDDLVHSGTQAALAHVSRPDSGSYADLVTLAQGGTPAGTHVRHAPSAARYAVFSDLHLQELGTRIGHFRNWGAERGEPSNADIYLEMLEYYDRAGYTVVEIGDIEDMLTRGPAYGEIWVDLFFDALLGPFGNYFDYGIEREQRIRKLLEIGLNHPDHYAKLRKLHAEGRFIKVIGNHDESLRDSYVLEVLRKIYRSPIDTYDYLVLGEPGAPASHIMAHGHQYDPYCATGAEELIGEVFTESLAWFGSGPDRVWPRSTSAPPGWAGRMSRKTGFDNHISLAPSFLKEENVAFKFRHMDERRVVEEMKRRFADQARAPTLVLGHTHEPRDRALDSSGTPFANYLNTGSAGLYEQLVWGVEIVDGRGSVHAWHADPAAPQRILHRRMDPTADGRLIPSGTQERGSVEFARARSESP